MKPLILIATLFLFVPSGVLAGAEDKDKPTKLDGNWKVVKEIIDGKEKPGVFVNTIKGSKVDPFAFFGWKQIRR